MATWVGGLDGCKGAWAGVLINIEDPTLYRTCRFGTIEEALDAAEQPLIVGVDVPIGLPDRTPTGGRPADTAARAALGAKGASSVFKVPPRAAIYAESYDLAKALSLEGSDPPFKPSVQCWGIFRYIREADALLLRRADARRRVREVHPEVGFRFLNGGRPLQRKKTKAGQEQRCELLVQAGLLRELVFSTPPSGVGIDDHLDAMLGALIARDILDKTAVCLPDPPTADERGLQVAIWAPRIRNPDQTTSEC